MADGNPRKSSKKEKAEQFAVLSDLVDIRKTASEAYEKRLKIECRSRLQGMVNGTAVDLVLPKDPNNYGVEAQKLADGNESLLSEVHQQLQKLKHHQKAAEEAAAKLDRDAETMRKVLEIEKSFGADGKDFYDPTNMFF